MIKLQVEVTPYNDYIPSHFIELNFNEEQINIIKSAAISMGKLMQDLNYTFQKGAYILHGIDLIMPVATWKGEELSYKMTATVVKVFSESFYILGHTEGLNILIESKEINLTELGIFEDANTTSIS